MKLSSVILVFAFVALFIPTIRPAKADGYSQPLSNLEARAFGQAQISGTDEERVGVLEQKAYGKVHSGALPLRIAALQYYLGVPAGAQPSVGNFRLTRPKDDASASSQQDFTPQTTVTPDNSTNPTPSSPNVSVQDYQNPESSSQHARRKAPLQAGISTVQLHMAAGDDERFGGLWVGTLASKIDPHVKVFCELHGSGKNFTGTMIWTSAICGGCRRTIIGYFDPKDQACMMKDLKVEPLNPQNPAGFCRVDKYAFGVTENVGRLYGWFKSSQCNDEGAVTLVRYRE